jgi:hypothetical protein
MWELVTAEGWLRWCVGAKGWLIEKQAIGLKRTATALSAKWQQIRKAQQIQRLAEAPPEDENRDHCTLLQLHVTQ